MKRMFIMSIIALLATMSSHQLFAQEYLTYQSITFERGGGRLLRDFRHHEYENYYNFVNGRRFWGWRTHTVQRDEPVYFQKETLYIIVNEGFSPITKTYTFRTASQSKFQVSATGNIGVNLAGNVKGFKLGLDNQIRPSISYEKQESSEEKVEIKILVDPQTKLCIEVYGEGRITNGVAKYYRFWFNIRRGGWEVFTLTTEYYSIVKEPLIRNEDIQDDDPIFVD